MTLDVLKLVFSEQKGFKIKIKVFFISAILVFSGKYTSLKERKDAFFTICTNFKLLHATV